MRQQMEPPKIDLFLLGSLWLRKARRCWALGLVLAALGTAALGWYGAANRAVVYEAYASVAPLAETATDGQLHSVLPGILRSELLSRQVCAYLQTDSIPQVTTTVLANAEVYTMRVRHPDPEWSWRILEAMVECAPEVACYTLGDMKLVILADSGIPAEPVPVRPAARWMLLGAAAGTTLWAVLVLALTLLRQTIRTEGELELECLGTLTAKDRDGCVQQLSLRLRKLPQGRRVVLIAGAMPGEGATALVNDLARDLAQRGSRVLVLDCDRYAPSGWDVEFRTADPADRQETNRLLEDARREYDFVLLDVPPCALTADGAVLSDLADWGLPVIRRDHAARHQIREMLALLTGGGMPLIGWVFNKA